MSQQQQQPPPYNPGYNAPPPNAGWAPPPAGGYAPPPNAGFGYPPPPNTGYGGGAQQLPPMPPPVHAPYSGYNAAPANDSDVEWGGGGVPKNSELGFSNTSIRQAFVRKVFTLLTIQLSVVAAMVALFVFEKNTQNFVRQHSWLYYVSYAVFLVTYITLVCCESVRRRFPGNMICLGALTLAMGYMVAMISSFYDVTAVFIALAITVVSCAAIIVFAMQTKYDFTGCVAVMAAVGFALFFFGIAAIIGLIWFKSQILYIVYAGISVVFFMIWLAIDVQLVMGGKRMEIHPEDYVFATIQLFLDIVYIFIYILQIVGYASK